MKVKKNKIVIHNTAKAETTNNQIMTSNNFKTQTTPCMNET